MYLDINIVLANFKKPKNDEKFLKKINNKKKKI